MGAVNERMAQTIYDPASLLEYFKHCVKRDRPLRPGH